MGKKKKLTRDDIDEKVFVSMKKKDASLKKGEYFTADEGWDHERIRADSAGLLDDTDMKRDDVKIDGGAANSQIDEAIFRDMQGRNPTLRRDEYFDNRTQTWDIDKIRMDSILAVRPTEDKPKIVEVQGEEHFEELLVSLHKKLIILEFHADWCEPCQEMDPVVQDMAESLNKVVFLRVDVDKHKNFAKTRNVDSYPTYFAYYNQTLMKDILKGADEKTLNKFVKKMKKEMKEAAKSPKKKKPRRELPEPEFTMKFFDQADVDEHEKLQSGETADLDDMTYGEKPELFKQATHLTGPPVVDYTTLNPFVPRTPAGCWEKLKMYTIILPMIRIILIVIIFLFQWFFCFLGTLCLKPNYKVPLSRWRRAVIYPSRLLSRVFLFCLGFWWISEKDERSGQAKKRPVPDIIVCNHIGVWDPEYFFYKFSCCVASKKEVFEYPLVGTVLHAWECLPIDRLAGGKKAIADICERANTPNFPPLLIFPEGTCSNDLILTMFKRGAFIPGLRVQPVALRYPGCTHDVFCGPIPIQNTIWRDAAQFVNFMRITIIEPYSPVKAEKDDPELYALNIRDVIANVLQVPTSEHSFYDVRLRAQAKKMYSSLKLDVQEFVVDDVHDLYGMKVNNVEHLLKQFAKYDVDKDGLLEEDEFLKALALDSSSKNGLALFKLMANTNGRISFRDYMSGMALCTAKALYYDNLNFLFTVTDVDQNGAIEKHELIRMEKIAKHVGTDDESEPLLPGSDFDFNLAPVYKALFKKKGESVSFKDFTKRLDEYEFEIRQFVKLLLWRKLGALETDITSEPGSPSPNYNDKEEKKHNA